MAEARRMQDETGGRPSLDALNRTIEGLESRLGDLMEARAPSRRLPPLPGAERAAAPQAAGSARMDAELRDISRTLRDLRSSLREDFTASLRDELASLHDMLSHIDRQTDTREVDAETRGELLRISEGIDWLVANAAADDDSRLMAEFSNLQTMLRGLADAKSIERLEGRFDGIERQLEGLDPARLDGDLASLAKGLDDIKRGLAAGDSREHLEEIEERLSTLAQAMETLCTRLPASSKRLDGQVTAIERRIGDIDRNLERIGRRQNEAVRDPAVERMETRLGELGNALAAIDWQMRDQGNKQAVLLENLETLARRIEKYGEDDGHIRLEARLDKLAGAIENLRPGIDREALGEAVAGLAEKIGQVDVAGAERRLAGKLDSFAAPGFDEKAQLEIRERFDRLTQLVENGKPGIEPRALEDAVTRLSDRIGRIDIAGLERRIAARLDAQGANELDAGSRREIREQFEKLAGLIENGKDGIAPQALEDAVSRINDRIARIDIDGLERRFAARLQAKGPAALDDATQQEIRGQFEKLAAAVENGRSTFEPRALEEAVARIDEKLGRIDIEALERRIAARLQAPAGLDGETQREIRSQFAKLAAAVENGRSTFEPRALEEAVARIDEKLGRIDIEALERRIAARLQAPAGLDGETQREIRSQFAKLAAAVENGKSTFEPRALEEAVARIDEKLGRIDIEALERRIAARLQDIGPAGLDNETRRELRAQFDRLASLVENGKGGLDPRMLEEAVARIDDRISRIDLAAAERRLASKIDAMPVPSLDRALRHQIEALDPKAVEEKLVRRIDSLDLSGMEERLGRRLEALEQNGTEARLSAQLAALAAQLDETRRDDSGQSLKKLERQIAELTTLASRPAPKLPFSELEERLSARIEAMSASNDDYVIEAAQHAAEEVLKTFSESRRDETDAHVRTITALAADMKALYEASRAEGDRTGLDTTLKSIANRLDTLQVPTKARDAEVENIPAKKPEPVAAVAPAEAPEKPDRAEADDVMAILSRVRASQAGAPAAPSPTRDLPYAPERKREPAKPAGVKNKVLNAPPPQGDLIAAARRAAQSAIANAEDMTPSISAEPRADRTGDEPPRKDVSRRPVYLAAGAILLAIMAYPMLKGTASDSPPAFDPIRPTAAPQHLIAMPQEQKPAPVAAQPKPVVAASPSLRDPQPREVAASFSQAVAPAADAFRMVETDNQIVTGSISLDRPEKVETTRAAPQSPVAGKPAPVAAAPAPVALAVKQAAVTDAPKAPAATPPVAESAAAPDSPVRTAATTVSTEDVLAMLSEPVGQSPVGDSEEPETVLRKSDETVLPKEFADTAKPPKPLDIPLPEKLEPQALATAARAGNAAALYEIGLRYDQGLGLPKDEAKAAIWMAEASDRGLVPATFQLGSAYEKGLGVTKDPKRAIALYRAAAEAGNVSAMHNLAVMLASGTGGEKPDFDAAARWFEKASDYGVGDSQFNLAILYARGTGVEHDLTQSYKWFAIAAQNGDAEAAKRRDEVADALAPEALLAGKKAVADWHAKTPKASANIVETPPEWTAADVAAASVDKEAVVRDIQSILNKNGYDAGPADGVLGARTDAAIRAFQKANGFAANGEITPELVKALLARNNA
ncbi:peptidoglycan-binding protein [Martelella endophytica]|uniref:Peptidoglycan binding-like domain-containing protein n=1 Tax=Martelella endophytica TaxID=1486262 RepID=A0A0D5LL72_MAREN|nr:peptidoglycan-binding protein [Martelella endophytica]AJY44517.1 hypothetical protein TM49_00555 [Martelella endophytica]